MTLILDGFQLACCGGVLLFFASLWICIALIRDAWQIEITPRDK